MNNLSYYLDNPERRRRILDHLRRNDILAFTLATKKEYSVNWHHKKLSQALNAFIAGDIQYLMVFMPPRHGKSELTSRRLPAFIHGKFPDDEIMAVSYLDSLAADMCTDVQEIMDTPMYKSIFPDARILPPRSIYTKGVRNSTEHTIIDHKGSYIGSGVGGSFTGRGADWILIDDPIKGREIADSLTYRDRLWNFWLNDLYSRLETNLKTGRKGQVLITQTRWHENDLSGRLLELMKKNPLALQWHVINFPAIRYDESNPEDPRAVGEALWPQKYDIAKLTEIKETLLADGGVRAWSSLYQQSPTPDGGGMFKDGMFRFGDLPGGYDYTFITGDTAYNEKKINDFNVFSVWGVIKGQLYLIDVYRRQIKAIDLERDCEPFILRYAVKYAFRGTWIEPKGHGIYLNQAFARKQVMIPSEDDRKDFYADRKFDKVERCNNVVGHMASRFIYVSNHIAGKEELVAEALGFPNWTHDDFVDTLIDAIKMVYAKEVTIFDLL